jgi:hypothetical protein
LATMMKSKPTEDWGDFVSSAETSTRSIAWAGQGPAGAGKTHFALTAPAPIAYFLLDPGGLKGLFEQEQFRDKDIRVIDLSKMLDWGRVDKEERVKRALEVVDLFNRNWDIAMKKARTVVIDKEDRLWETIRYAHDEVFSPTPKEFYELNLDYAALFAQAEAHGVNFGLLRGLKEKWGVTGISGQGKKQMGFTGELIVRGQKQVEEQVQINLAHRWDDECREFKVKILEKCRLGSAIDLINTEYPNLDFPLLGSMLFPNSSESDWS